MSHLPKHTSRQRSSWLPPFTVKCIYRTRRRYTKGAVAVKSPHAENKSLWTIFYFSHGWNFHLRPFQCSRLYFCGPFLMRGHRFQQVSTTTNSPTTSKWNGGIRDPAVGVCVGVSFPPLLNVTRRWKHTMSVSLSTSSSHNCAPVGARSRFTQRKITN